MEKADLIKEIYGLNTFSNVVDTEFSELITPTQEIPENPITIDDFFAYYDQFFYDIPLTGINSHSSLVERSSNYLGGNVIDEEKQALIEEINSLRQQLIDLGQSYAGLDQIVK